MTERFYQSPNRIDIDDHTPLIFLEGPVQGAPDWQTPFAHRLLKSVPGVAVASPRPTPEQLRRFASADTKTRTEASDRQVAYEFVARRLAFGLGAIAMWWAAQDHTLPHNPERVYAKTTSKEEGELWGIKFANPSYPFIVGYDPDFIAGPQNSRAYSERNHTLMGIKTYTSLEEVYEETERAAKELVTNGGSRQAPALTSQSIQQALDQLH